MCSSCTFFLLSVKPCLSVTSVKDWIIYFKLSLLDYIFKSIILISFLIFFLFHNVIAKLIVEIPHNKNFPLLLLFNCGLTNIIKRSDICYKCRLIKYWLNTSSFFGGATTKIKLLKSSLSRAIVLISYQICSQYGN